MERPLLIIGGGESGVGAALLAAQQGWTPHVVDEGTIHESRKAELAHRQITYWENASVLPKTYWALAVISPGIPPAHRWIQQLKDAHTPIEGEIDFAFRYDTAPVIAITGSNGKTTTTLLIAHILNRLGKKAVPVGNMGISYARRLAEENAPVEYRVIETSSFQLEHIRRFRPNVGVITNITIDHLDRHGSLDAYAAAKFHLFDFQTPHDIAILPGDNSDLLHRFDQGHYLSQLHTFGLFPHSSVDAWWEGNCLYVRWSGTVVSFELAKRRIIGSHNQLNIAAAVMAVISALQEAPSPAVLEEAVATFSPVAHRIEYVATYRGVAYYNDSKATNVDAAYYALSTFDSPIIWIVGGVDKGNDYGRLVELARRRVRQIIVLGPHRSAWQAAFDGIIPIGYAEDMESAVRQAADIARPGEVVLLSPACASFDLFLNFEQRGDAFRKSVQQLIQ